MLKNYWKIALRQLRKQKLYSSIKIGGFALSIAACLLIALFIRDELSYDRGYAHADRIYRLINLYDDNGKIYKGTAFSAPFAKAVKADFPEIELAGRIMPFALFYGAGSNEVMRSDGNQNTYEEGFTYADPEILDILEIPMVYGDRAHALAEPNTIVLSKRKADKYFPNQNPVGKILYLNNDKTRPRKIGGVMKDFPSNIHFQYDFLLTLTGHELWPGEQNSWGPQNYNTYIRMRPGTDAVQLQTKLKSVVKKYIVPDMIKAGRTDAEKAGKNHSFALQPVSAIHITADIQEGLPHGDMRFIWLFGAVACFILLIAGINFINLSTAKSANRAKEVGLRKVIGSGRASLVRQFLTESVLYSVCSFILAIVLAWLLLPYFNRLAAKSLVFPWGAWWLFPIILLAALVIGILAGLYPSFYLAAFKPIEVLKGNVSRGSRNSSLRSILVVFQFTTSVILIIGTIVVYRQMQFILNRKIGFDKDQVVVIQGTSTLDKEIRTFKNELLKLPSVKNVAISGYLPIADSKRDQNPFWKEGKTKEEAPVGGQSWWVDPDYIPTLGMKIVEGRNLSADIASDSQAIVINQTMAKKLLLQNPVGALLTNSWAKFTVVGVVQDFNFESMKEEVAPLCLHRGYSSDAMLVKVRPSDMTATIQSIGGLWKKFAPNQPIRYTFLDESYALMYDDVQRMGHIFTSFSMLAIIIACLGLFALSAFMAEQRGKEISIRKVLGASVTQLAGLLSGDFVKLVLLSVIIASPIAWWAMHQWLQDFVFRVDISAWVFVAAGALVILIALFTISFQAIRAATANPTERLRAE
ncbi:MAG TPA: ABC transporter permease [Puia sp.]|nr:ABC transporter permease [Puia sp.]